MVDGRGPELAGTLGIAAILATGCAARAAGAAARAPGSAAGRGSTNDLLLFVAVSANLHAPTRTDPAAEK